MNMKLELVPVPVTDVDKAIDFYVNKVGFNLDHDHKVSDEVRFVQLTPQGSACSILIGTGVTEMIPGSQQGLQVVVDDAQAVYEMLKEKGVDAPAVETMPWGTFTYFSDPDGNKWAVQQMPQY
jgi:predicted enzyme related to lactoylglutathione lyase